MTLVQYIGGGYIVVAMASDTRQVRIIPGSSTKIRVKDSDKKSGRISECVLFGAGGFNSPIDKAKELTLKYAGNAVYLDEFIPALERAIDTMRKDWLYKNDVEEEHCFQIILAGFNSDGSTARAIFTSGKDAQINFEVHESGIYSHHAIAPSQDEFEILKSYTFQHPKKIKEMPKKLIEYFAIRQKACFTNDPETVSEKCVYSLIFRNPNTREFKYFEGTVDLHN